MYDQEQHDLGLRYLKKGRFVPLELDVFVAAASASKQYKLHMTDAIIWQTAQSHGATLYTQDAALKDLPNVKFKAKPPVKDKQ
jgi:predicted nucleic acid-binding protein